MRNLSNGSDRFLKTMRTEAGSAFRGTIMPASDMQGSSLDYSSQRVILRTYADTLVQTGIIIVTPSNDRYMVAEHYSAEKGWRSWRLFKAEFQMGWTRPKKGVDPLTNLPKADGRPISLGQVWVNSEIERRMFADPGLKLPIERTTYLTTAAVKENDFLDGKQVVRSNHELGLYIVEVH